MTRARDATFSAATLGLALTSCSHFTRLSAGPNLGVVDKQSSAGGAIAAERVVGSTSPSDGFTGLGVGARGALRARSAEVAPYVGPYVGKSIGGVFVDGSLRLGPGLQLVDGRFLGFGSLGVTAGLGYAISDSGWRGRPAGPWNPWGIEGRPMPVGGPDVKALNDADDARRRAELTRDRVLVTFGLAADVDARLTRSPMLSLSALVGVAWMDEVKSSRGRP